MIISVTRHNFQQEIQQSEKPVIIEVYATWCGPCQHIMPYFEELANQYGAKYTFAKLNVDEARDIAIQFGISAVPAFLFLKKGELVGQEVGYMSKEDLEAKMKEILGE